MNLRKVSVINLKIKLFFLNLLGVLSLSSVMMLYFSGEGITSFKGISGIIFYFFCFISVLLITKKSRAEFIFRITLSGIGLYFIVGSFSIAELEIWVRFPMCFFGLFMNLPLFFRSSKIFELAMRSF